MNSHICFVSPYRELTSLLKETLADLPAPPMIVEGAVEAAESVIREAEIQGCEVFVTTEKNARHLRGKVNVPLVTIPFTVFDVAYALHRAKAQYGQPLALFEFRSSNPHRGALEEVVDCDVKEYVIQDQEDAVLKLRQAKEDGCRVVVAGGLTAYTARKVGFPCVPLCPSTAALLQAYREAQEVVGTLKKERLDAAKFNYITQCSDAGIIVTNSDNNITVFNSAAERICGLPAAQVLGCPVHQVIPGCQALIETSGKTVQPEELMVVGQTEILVSRVTIHDGGMNQGTIFLLRRIGEGQSAGERSIRSVHARGLTARMTFQDIVTDSKRIMEIVYKAQRFAKTDETVLITGETGTGKEIFAQSIHNASHRTNEPFVAVNCAAIPSTLIESELFGYAEGAFTGARRGGRRGLFELAQRGTIFLDEIGELPKETQLRLLRVLQEKEIMRVGDTKVIKVDVRVIGATNQPLEEGVREGRFRSDLYYRLNVLQITLPPLREHLEDLIPLARYFLSVFCPDRKFAQDIESIFQNFHEQLCAHPWYGNIRELQNVIKRIVALGEIKVTNSMEAEDRDFLKEILSGETGRTLGAPPILGNMRSILAEFERYLIEQQSQTFAGNKTALAKKLGIGRTTLWRRLKNAEKDTVGPPK